MSNLAKVSYIFTDTQLLKYNNWIAINRGAADGYRPGDAVHIIENRKDTTLKPRTVATGIIIVSQENTASVLIKNILYPARNIKLFDNVAIVQKAME